jgi:hypothetical protein
MTAPLSAAQHAMTMPAYFRDGLRRARDLGNRGPIRLDSNGRLHPDILKAYWCQGFYVFEDIVGQQEPAVLQADVARVLDGAPTQPGRQTDARGRPAVGSDFARPAFNFVKPLSDPVGGTDRNKGRHPVRMDGPEPSAGAPEWTITNLSGNLQLMDSCLRLYGHPGLLAIADAVLGPDFVPYNEVAFIKEPGLGPSVAWHQDGTTHWDAPDWDHGAHGFNFMVQLYPSTPGNGVWVLPGSHTGRADIRALVAASGSERIDGAVPLVCDAGATIIVNRQLLHGSFANTSADRRITLNEGFFPRHRLENITTTQLSGKTETYTSERIDARSRIIALGIDARGQYYPAEQPYCYQPLADDPTPIRWNDSSRESLLKDYNLQDMYI